MAIIGTLPSRFSDKDNNFTKALWYEHVHKDYLYFRPRLLWAYREEIWHVLWRAASWIPIRSNIWRDYDFIYLQNW
jgi:hypothetical protein